eukprot:TRINITY_DN16766_c0_g1_i1.p1 TRINITY_DN16766_c0_g1~~TRINITY_DN16766_c0_g1_i1.p1  ORF type:complete len:361 (-),score=61.27 TRINITY_DN16766_c0_g1_i1:276-1358(-)
MLNVGALSSEHSAQPYEESSLLPVAHDLVELELPSADAEAALSPSAGPADGSRFQWLSCGLRRADGTPRWTVLRIAAFATSIMVLAALCGTVRQRPKTDAEILAETSARARVAAEKLGLSLAEIPPIPNDPQADKASCVLDVVQAASFIGSATLAIRASVLTCDGTPANAACSATINGVLLSVGWVASFLSLAASQCGSHLNPGAICGADGTCLFASMADMATGGSVIQADCVEGMNVDFDLPSTVNETVSAADRGAEITGCVLDVVQMTSLLGVIGLNIDGAKFSCDEKDLDQKFCSVNVLNIISSFSFVAQYIALIINDCPEAFNVRAGCASGATELIAGTTSLVACGVAMSEDCAGL